MYLESQAYFKPYKVESHKSYIEDIFNLMNEYLHQYSQLNRKKLELFKLINDLLENNYDTKNRIKKKRMCHKLYKQIICINELRLKDTIYNYMSVINVTNIICHIQSDLNDPIKTFYNFDEVLNELSLQLETIKSNKRIINNKLGIILRRYHGPIRHELNVFVTEQTKKL